MNKGDIILVPFPFSDLTDTKLRPAVVLLDSGHDVLVSFITSQNKWDNEFSVKIKATATNGLKVDSFLRLSKITSIDKNLIEGKLGILLTSEIVLLDKVIFKMLQLKIPE